ncbi:MAG TPA: orotidine-5'-phosphate decarboxylase [Gemmatimonadaceae bacterium]|nr:orotidine-5'-phosphate decarboxylase [Gemmatimonadaceae bacterium]
MSMPTPIVALDSATAADALGMVGVLGERCRFYKVGSELFTAEGPAIVAELQARGADVFLDLKFHDIPNTVRGSVRSAARLGVRLLTVHASGGTAMVRAAVEEAASAGECKVLVVTVLTSLDRNALADAWGREIPRVDAEVVRLAGLAADAGAHGIVCSGLEAARVREVHGNRLATLVPGVRLAEGAAHDQARVVTPRQAAEAGARYVVIGRAVTAAKSPADAMEHVLADLS